MIVEYEGYLIEQMEDDYSAFVYKNGKRVMHLGLSGALSSDELVSAFAECLRITGQYSEETTNDVVYDGEEPC